MDVAATTQDIIQFWFEETPPKMHFVKDTAFDDEIRRRFLGVHTSILRDTLPWLENAGACLAAIIVLDQFSRNMFRDTATSFAADPIAVRMARLMIEEGWVEAIPEHQQSFALMPFMHSEELAVHEWAKPYFEKYTGANTQDYERRHAEIIARFGRYPHRNTVLDRESTPEEIAFVDSHAGF